MSWEPAGALWGGWPGLPIRQAAWCGRLPPCLPWAPGCPREAALGTEWAPLWGRGLTILPPGWQRKDILAELTKSQKVFSEKLDHLSRRLAWVRATVYSQVRRRGPGCLPPYPHPPGSLGPDWAGPCQAPRAPCPPRPLACRCPVPQP